MLDANTLPSDVESLKRLLIERDATIEAKDLQLREKQRQIEHLKLQLAKLRRAIIRAARGGRPTTAHP